ncbi:helicase HerA-like domain-containing protein [Marinimicrococcus flavescens]|uniref:DUF853 family protein n=1 Tax=Marinimicrococcus flavescens TaxID=3031815 RepID=A0AAP4D662_9PROT|nr:DUF853 family protein [Marinimicrococcus flavescens]
MSDGTIFLGLAQEPQLLHLALANRHGLVAGATGTGKTVTLQVMAESFSRAGVPVFCADVKGDLSGVGVAGGGHAGIEKRAARLGLEGFSYEAAPAVFWDLFGEQGHPARATVAEMGPLLLARLLELNDTQEGVLNIAFKIADEEGLLLLDLKDLQAMLQFLGERSSELTTLYGNVSRASIGAIQRRLLTLEQQGAAHFFGEPALDLDDLLLLTPDGRGAVNVLMAQRLMQAPRLYATFLLWLLSELFEELPEVGDQPKPKLVFFFDEAHLLFRDAPKPLVEKVEQVVRLIRSKGVGVYLVTQNPADIPPSVLGQLGNRVQHALRAFTPVEQRGVRAAAETFRPNPAFDTGEAITQLGVGEALVSVLEPGGVPSMVQRTLIAPPRSKLGPPDTAERERIRAASPLGERYTELVDRQSAYEMLTGRATTVPAEAEPHSPWGAGPAPRREEADPWGTGGRPSRAPSRRIGGGQRARPPAPRMEREKPAGGGWGGMVADILSGGSGRRQGVGEALTKSVVRSIGSQVGRSIARGILGSILKR